MAVFRDRGHAGEVLAAELTSYAGRDVVVLGLARGGVPVAAEVAAALSAALDVFVVRKIGLPGREELAMGAIASGGATVRNEAVITRANVPPQVFATARSRALVELQRREFAYRGGRPAVPVHGRTVIVVDDGLATGASMQAAVVALRQQHPARIIVAVPVALPETCAWFADQVDGMVCPCTPRDFHAVGSHYEDFAATEDDDVRRLLVAGPRPD